METKKKIAIHINCIKIISVIIAEAILLAAANALCADRVFASNSSDAEYFYELAQSSEKSGDYETAGNYYAKAAEYGELAGRDDISVTSSNKALHYGTYFDTYFLTSESQKTYGAKYEPTGLLYGEVAEKSTSDESLILLYLDYGDTSTFDWTRTILKNAKSSGKSVELALNFSGADLMKKIMSDKSYLKKVSDLINDYPSVPVYLRIGAEMNIWSPLPDADEYKKEFIEAAQYFRTNSPQVAIMWSVAHTSAWDVDFRDYYPGDQYVDWVGVSAYSNKYFNGDDASWDDCAYFHTGDFSDPSLIVYDVIEEYGDRKPIMIVESGASYYTAGSKNETHLDWAEANLRKLLAYIPMRYPQVKAIAYFNKKMTNETNYYDLGSHSEMQDIYDELTSNDWFIHNSSDNTSVSWKACAEGINISGDTLKIGSYTHVFGMSEPTVTYYIDGSRVFVSDTVPYYAELDLGNYKNGTHTLKCVMKASNGITRENEYTLNISGNETQFSYFDDISSLSSTQKSVLKQMFDAGVITGYEDSTMRPYDNLTRAEFTAMLCRAMGYSASGTSSFSDSKDHWATSYIKACADRGIVNGVGNNKFAPDDNVLFEEAVKIIVCSKGLDDGYDIESMGGYPSAYIKLGRSYSLYENLENPVRGEELSRIDAVMLLANVSDTDSIKTSGKDSGSGSASNTSTSGNTSGKTSEWSEWSETLPAKVKNNSKDYETESKTQYSYRTIKQFETQNKLSDSTPESTETSYGSWSDWSETPITETSSLDVETKTESSPKRYHYAHYCTGKTSDSSNSYLTAESKWSNECTYHDLGWFDSPLPYSSDTTKDYAYYVNGELYRCSNTCYRWYLIETSGGTKTLYRSRKIYHTYTYNSYGYWSEYSDTKPSGGSDIEIRTRTMYRYRNKN